MSDLREYVVTYKNEAGVVVCNIPDYYAKIVVPLEVKYKGQVLTPKHLAICPVHDDHDPSFGLMKDRKRDGVYLFHCFGCNQTGDIVSLHKKVMQRYYNQKLDDDACCKALIELFGIPLPTIETLEKDSPERRYMEQFSKIDSLSRRYSESEFKRNIMGLRMQGVVDLDKVNFECIKLMVTKRGVV